MVMVRNWGAVVKTLMVVVNRIGINVSVLEMFNRVKMIFVSSWSIMDVVSMMVYICFMIVVWMFLFGYVVFIIMLY